MRINRILKVLIELLEGDQFTQADLAYKFDVAEKTIERDIKFLKKSGIPIMAKQGTGYYISNDFALKKTKLSDKEKEELSKLLKGHNKIPENQVKKIMEKIESNFINNNIGWFMARHETTREEKNFENLKNGIINKQFVIAYLEENNKRPKIIEPYKIILDYGKLYVLYYDIEKEEFYDIALDKIIKAEITEEKFEVRRLRI